MKPLKLKMEYFGSYVNETVDFAQFDEVPLFMISGKTGSGKTTILTRCALVCLVQRLIIIAMDGLLKKCALILPRKRI